MKVNFKNPLFILGLGSALIAGSVFGATRAQEKSAGNAQKIEFTTGDFTVDIQEKQDGSYVSLGETGKLQLDSLSVMDQGVELKENKPYTEEIKVKNTGDYQEYIRVRVVKSWLNQDGSKDTDSDPQLITLDVEDGWGCVASNPEEVVCYFKAPVNAGDEKQLLNAIIFNEGALSGSYSKTVEIVDGYQCVTVEGYKGEKLQLDVKVDALQAGQKPELAEAAMLGAWGVEAVIQEDGTIKTIDGIDL